MTAQTRSTLKNAFEQGDRPQGSDFADLIDSFLSISDTASQTITSPVVFGGAVSFNGEVSAASLTVGGAASFGGKVTTATASVGLLEATTVASSFISGARS
jgi:hypothetical protein